MREIHLFLKHKWYDLIKSGVKKEEYRDIKDYYRKKFENNTYHNVIFHRGYTSTKTKYKIENISIGKGKQEWGADPNKNYYIIKFKNPINR